jgi:GntR family transcriptional repressor for pyruvate dehydrogenase complex
MREMTQLGTNLTAYSRVANELRQLILAGELIPGERLPVEDDLAERFGVSRSTVREALRSLTSQNLAITIRGVSGGTFVNRPDPDQVSDLFGIGLGFLTVAEEVSVAEMMEARQLLEVPAARSAAHLRSPEQLERILESIHALPSIEAAPNFDANRGFHMRIVEAAGNRLLEVMTRPIFYVLHTRFLRDAAPRLFWRQVDAEHRRIGEAIELGDSDLAAAEMTEHLEHLHATYKTIDRQAGRST